MGNSAEGLKPSHKVLPYPPKEDPPPAEKGNTFRLGCAWSFHKVFVDDSLGCEGVLILTASFAGAIFLL